MNPMLVADDHGIVISCEYDGLTTVITARMTEPFLRYHYLRMPQLSELGLVNAKRTIIQNLARSLIEKGEAILKDLAQVERAARSDSSEEEIAGF
jgi:hypothetical protein